jgi:capsular polysaccharide biosynthesis protein
MRPEQLLGEVLRRWWILLLATLVAATVAYIGTANQDKTYTVSVRVMAIASPPDYWLDLYAKNRLASYKDLINNWNFVSRALTDAGLDIDPGLAQSKLSLGHNPDTNVIQIIATDTEPSRAADIVNALAAGFVRQNDLDNERFIAEVEEIEDVYPGRVNMVQLETANPPTTASGPRVRVNTLAGAVLGFAAGLLIVFGLIYLDDTLRSREEVVRYLQRPLLAVTPERTGPRGGGSA